MPCVTLLVTGVPRYALLENLSRHLDRLFDTDEIGTFKLRNLPDHPRTNKRQVALDFRSGFDAMAAQAKLDNFVYEYNGEKYTLNAKISKVQEYMRSGSFSPESNFEDESWQGSALRMIPDVCYDANMYRATNSQLNAQLVLLRKQKLIVEAERELLRERKKLKREYGSTDYHDSEHEATTSKHRRRRSRGRRSGSRGRRSGSRGRRSGSRGRRSGSRGRRSGSRGRRSGSRRRRSKSREGHVVRGSKERRTRSRDRSRSRIAWDDRTRQLRSCSKERRSQSHETHARDRSMSRELSDLRSLILSKRARSKSRERSKSDERVHPKTERRYLRHPRSRSREHYYRERSQSYERDYRDQMSRERDRERRSMSKERDDDYYTHSRERAHRDCRSTSRSRYYSERRSKERDVRRSRSRKRRSESRNRTLVDDVIVMSRSRDYRVRRSRTPDYRHRHQLAIMPNPERSEAPKERAKSETIRDRDADNSKCENIENAPQIKGKISETNGAKIVIDIDSPDKPVPKRPQFYLVIKRLVKDMKRVIGDNDLTQLIKISDLEYVLRHTLRDLLKGQGYLPNKEIRNKFRAVHPMEKDNQFIKNVIKDIKDGKYPALTGLPTTDKCEDDVILIEKIYDVVTVEDSDDDDDDVTTTREQDATPQIPTLYPVDSSLEISGTANLGTTNIGPEKHELAKDKQTKLKLSKPDTTTHVPFVPGLTTLGPSELRPNPSPCNPAQVNSSLSNFCATEVPTDPTASRWDLFNPCSVNLDPNEPAHNPTPGSIQPDSTVFIPASGTPELVTGNPETSKHRLVNPNEMNSSLSSFGATEVPTNPTASRFWDLFNPCSINLDPNEPAHNPTPGSIQPHGSTVFIPASGTSKLRVVNRGTANPGSAVVRTASGTSKLVTVNPVTSKFRLANQVNLRTSNTRPLYCSPPNLRPTYVSPPNVTVTQRSTNPSTSRWDLIKPRSANLTPFKLSPNIVEIETDSSNLSQGNSGPSNDTQVKLNPFNIAQVYPDPSSHDATELRPTNPRTFRWDLVNPGSPNLSVTVFRPKPVSPGACKFLPACLRPTELRPARATSKIRPVTPGLATGAVKTISQGSQTTEKANTANIDKTGIMADTDKCKANENETNTVKGGTENSSNSLKVTAITIVTSLNELAAITDKTADGPTMEVPIENIKEEIPFENSDTELTDAPLKLAPNQSSLVTCISDKANSENAKHNENKAIKSTEDNSSNSLKVTAITIVTSLNELTKITDKTTDRSKMKVSIEDIKEEIPFENSEETDSTLGLDHVTSSTEIDNTENVEDCQNKAIERVEERNDNNLTVTAITILTSFTELAAIADTTDWSKIEIPVEGTENSETEQIDFTSKSASNHESKKEENDDEENAMPNTEGTNNYTVDSSSGEGIARIVQENSSNLELNSSENRTSQAKTASDEEDETIESIVRYVQSFM